MLDKLIKDIEEKINKSNEFVIFFDKTDVVTLVKVIKILELEIEDKLQEYYQNCIIEVEFIDFRKYKIIVKIETKK